MILREKSPAASLLVCAVLILTYLSGYAVIRNDCQSFGSKYFVVPRYLSSSAMLRAIYRPCFRLEGKVADRNFSITPWGMVSP